MALILPFRRARTPGLRRKSLLPPAWLALPSLAVAASMVLPVVYLLVRASEAGPGAWPLLWRPRTLQVLVNTLSLALAVSASAVLIGVPLGWLTVRSNLPLRRLWSVLTVLPLAIPSLVGGFTFIAAFGYGGAAHTLLRRLGVQAFPDIYGFFGAWATLTLLSYPYVVLSVRGALNGMDFSQEEAARTLGHTPWDTFRRVTLPQLRPAIASSALLVSLYTLSDFAAVSLMQFDSFTRAIYIQYQASFNRSYAAVLSLPLVILTLVLVLAEHWTRGRARYHRSGTGSGRPAAPVPLGRWRWPALAFCGAVTLLSLGVPAATSLYWLITGIRHGEPLILSWAAVWNSVHISALAAAAAVMAALPVALLAVRHPHPFSRWIERLAYAGYALPGIVVALSLVFFGATFARPLYQTRTLLVTAYVILFLPQALGTVRASLLQLSPNLEHAARSLGLSPLATLWRVTLPLIRSGLLAGAALVFLTVMKELPATLLLSPIGFQTLTTQIWGAIGEAHYARAAAPALLLMAASSLSVAIVLNQQARPSQPSGQPKAPGQPLDVHRPSKRT